MDQAPSRRRDGAGNKTRKDEETRSVLGSIVLAWVGVRGMGGGHHALDKLIQIGLPSSETGAPVP